MTTPTTAKSRRPLVVIGAIVLIAAVAAAEGLWYLFFRAAGPGPVSLASMPPAAVASSTPTTSGASADPATSADPASSDTGEGDATAGLDGTWSVDASIGSLEDGTGSFVGYRVQEQLATVGAAEAVGRTSGVTGSLTIDGTTISAADVSADLTSLQSDESNRDRQLSRQALQTSQYPTATFTLTQPIELGKMPADGEVVEAKATGDLTLHGVTKSVEVALQARLDGDVITVAGSLPITFADWSIQEPQAMVVLSVEDHGTMELQLHFVRA